MYAVTDTHIGSNFFILGTRVTPSPTKTEVLNYDSTALMTLLMGSTYHAHNIVASVLVMVWATRLAGQ